MARSSSVLRPLRLLPRLGFAARLIAIVLFLVMAAIAVAAGVSLVSRTRDPASRFPVADQIAALHALVDRAPAELRPLILRSANSDTMSVTIVRERPVQAQVTQRLPGVEWLISQYLESLSPNEVFASEATGAGLLWRLISPLAPIGGGSVKIAISMSSGEFLLLGVRGTPAARVYGIPIGFWFGGLCALLASLVVAAVMREARPISALARSVSSFGADATPHPVEVVGAPEIRTLIEASNAMQQRIAELVHGRTVLLGAISHDLKSYLTRLRLRIEDIMDESARRRAVRDLDDMTQIIDDSLAVARGAAPLARRDCVVLADLIAADHAERNPQRVIVEVATDAAGATITGDATGLRRVLSNLVDNALAHGTVCRASLTREGADAVLTIADDGPGIAVTDIEAVFEPFWRADASRSRATGGTGLGLAITRQIVTAHGGHVRAANGADGGAVFTVRLPLGTCAGGH